MIIIFAHKLADDIKTKLPAEIENLRPGICVTVTQKTPEDIKTELLTATEKLRAEEKLILENIPEMNENPPRQIIDKSGMSLTEQNARKHHTKNMIKSFNIAKQRYAKQKYHNNRNKMR